jgi:hypothetical protein
MRVGRNFSHYNKDDDSQSSLFGACIRVDPDRDSSELTRNAVAAGMILADPTSTVKPPTIERAEMMFLTAEQMGNW